MSLVENETCTGKCTECKTKTDEKMSIKESAEFLTSFYAKLAENDNGAQFMDGSGRWHDCEKVTDLPSLVNYDKKPFKVNPPKQKPQIDWMKVTIGTPVLVSDNFIIEYYEEKFLCYLPKIKEFLTFSYGKNQTEALGVRAWKYCRISPGIAIPKAWLKT